MTTLAEFVEIEGFTLTAVPVAAGMQRRAEWPVGSTHWRCTLRHKSRRSKVVLFSMGPACVGSPDILDVLGNIQSNIGSITGEADWTVWAQDMGMPHDARSRRIFYACQREAVRMCAILGADGMARFLECDPL